MHKAIGAVLIVAFVTSAAQADLLWGFEEIPANPSYSGGTRHWAKNLTQKTLSTDKTEGTYSVRVYGVRIPGDTSDAWIRPYGNPPAPLDLTGMSFSVDFAKENPDDTPDTLNLKGVDFRLTTPGGTWMWSFSLVGVPAGWQTYSFDFTTGGGDATFDVTQVSSWAVNVWMAGHAGGGYIGNSFRMDNWTYVPEPVTFVLLAMGSIGVLVRRR